MATGKRFAWKRTRLPAFSAGDPGTAPGGQSRGIARFFGGAVGYISYDMVRHFEKLPECSHDELNLPECVFVFTDTMIIFDHVQHKMKIVANNYIDGPIESVYKQAIAKIESIVSRLSKKSPPESMEQTEEQFPLKIKRLSLISRRKSTRQR